MNFIGNILWIILGGFIIFLMYCLAGLLMCITIIGIPFGVQLMKLGLLALFPFGREITYQNSSSCLSVGFNILWVIFGWWEIALVHLVLGCLLGITIIGIPFAKQHFKLIKLSLTPFGMTIQ